MSKQMLKLTPFIVDKIWGGQKLITLRNLSGYQRVGETWEVSTHENGPSQFEGQSVLSLGPSIFSDDGKLPYLIKFIDTIDNLSVQVHPDDEYAARVEGCEGKTECWLILSADEDAGIYLGLKDGVTKESFESALKSKEDLSKLMVFHNVSEGDFFYVPAGSIHAIGKGVTLIEVQQSTDKTYRVWDWNRLDDQGQSRELHIDKALDVINFEKTFNDQLAQQARKNCLKVTTELADHPTFKAKNLYLEQEESFKFSRTSSERACSFILLKGSVEIHQKNEKIKLEQYENVLFSKEAMEEIVIHAGEESSLLIVE